MTNYLLAYHGGAAPSSPEQAKQVMAEWDAWFESIGSAVVEIMPTNHPGDTQSYKIIENNIVAIYMTDNDPYSPTFQKTSFAKMVKFCENADLLIHDTMFTQEEWEEHRTWGHASIDAGIDLAREAGVKRFVLFHHDPSRTDDEVDEMVRYTREKLGGQSHGIQCFGAQEGMELNFD